MQLGREKRAPTRTSVPSGTIPNPRSLTAAGERVTKQKADGIRRLVQPWQTSAYLYYDAVPEIKYAAQFYSRSLSSLRLFAAEKDERGEWQEIEDKNHPAVVELDRVQDPGGGRSSLLSAYGRLMFLGGEAYLVATRDQDTGDEEWEMLSPDELRATSSGYTRYRAPSLTPETYLDPPDDDFEPMAANEAVVYRLWRRHPRFSSLADSTMHGVLDVCEELVLLTKAVRSRARSRLAQAGILIVNGNVIPVPQEGDAADEDPDEDPFLVDLTRAMTTAISDEGSAAAVVPMVIRVDVDDKTGIDAVLKHIQIVDPTQLYPEQGMRREAVERLAIGLDMPPEELTGIADANHWTGWIVDENSWKAHLQPVAGQLVDDLTASFFRPTLREAGFDDWRNVAIRYDAAEVINHPDRSKDAKDLYDRRAIGKKALRDAGNFTDDDAPTEEELWEMIGTAVHDGSLAIYGIPTLKSGGIEPQAGEVEGQGGTVDSGISSAEAPKGPPEQPTQTDERPSDVVASVVLASRIMGAADLALLRCRELAGARLRNYAKRDPDGEKLIDGVPAGLVAATLGRDRALSIRIPPERELVAGAGELIRESLRQWRIDDRIADSLAERIEQHAARTLYDERPGPLPASFAKYVREAATA